MAVWPTGLARFCLLRAALVVYWIAELRWIGLSPSFITLLLQPAHVELLYRLPNMNCFIPSWLRFWDVPVILLFSYLFPPLFMFIFMGAGLGIVIVYDIMV